MTLFALGFRPFYLLAGIYAAVSVPLYALQYAGVLPGADPLWHAHEMLFGYTFAVIAGFLFTAVRNWTGRDTPTGATLASIAAVWIAARAIAPWSLAAAAALDLAFAAAVAWGIGRPLVASSNRRNLFMVAVVLALGAASVAFLAWPAKALELGLGLVLLVMAIMAGRVVPMFTNNAVPGARATQKRWLEVAALACLFVLVLLSFFGEANVIAATSFVAAGLHAARLALWKPWKTLRKPILWILHVAYAWIVVHLALRGFAGFGVVAPALATHALTAGAIGSLTLGMMTRTARGHTGRMLVAGPLEVGAYAAVTAAAAVRVLVPLAAPEWYIACVQASGLLWSVAFGLFALAFVPVLTQPRLDGRPG